MIRFNYEQPQSPLDNVYWNTSKAYTEAEREWAKSSHCSQIHCDEGFVVFDSGLRFQSNELLPARPFCIVKWKKRKKKKRHRRILTGKHDKHRTEIEIIVAYPSGSDVARAAKTQLHHRKNGSVWCRSRMTDLPLAMPVPGIQACVLMFVCVLPSSQESSQTTGSFSEANRWLKRNSTMVAVAISFPAIKACGQCARVAGYWLRPGTNLNECGDWWRLRKKAKNFDHHPKPKLGARSHQTSPNGLVEMWN